MDKQKTVSQIIEERAKKKRCRIGISILEESDEILESLRRAQEVADIVIYSNHKIKGFETIILSNDEEIGRALVVDYKEGRINQFVRGQVDDFGTVDEFKKQFNIPSDEKRLCLAQLEDVKGREFFLTMASNPEGQTLEDKIRIVEGSCKWMKEEFGVNPRVAIMATCRPGSVGKDPVMTKSYEEAEYLVKYLTEKGYEAKNIHIELQNALPWANLIAPSNGTIGNQIFRALVLLGGGKNMLTPTIFSKGSYEDNSRNETDYYSHIVFACALANK
ncbi:MAG: hypothetical protein ACD_11C00103G0002 [uncultured bacterium]|nr:MAG: hypothetical protein ACD_11C00103G0002 [uncultured bacterium]HBR71907.1 hypothetical protein [Candidatus Moranbacteria bacterium]